jgi:hypothetical protein
MRIIIAWAGVEPISASRLTVDCLSDCWARSDDDLGKRPPQAASASVATTTIANAKYLETGNPMPSNLPNKTGT